MSGRAAAESPYITSRALPAREFAASLPKTKALAREISPATQATPCATTDITIGHYRNVRGLGKSMVVFSLFDIQMKDQLYFRVFTPNRSIWRRKMAKW